MNNLNEILKNMQLEKISSEDTGYQELPDGYYLAEVEKVEFTVSKSGKDMIKWQFKVVENGIRFNSEYEKEYIEKSINRKIFMFSLLSDENSVQRTLSNLLKFEKDEGKPILNAEYFINQEILAEALQLLNGANIFIHLDTDKNGNQWKRLVSWKGAAKLELV